MPEEEIWFRVVAIDEQDGVTVREHSVLAADRDQAEKMYLHGDFNFGPQVGEEESPFHDSSRVEYIKCIEPF